MEKNSFLEKLYVGIGRNETEDDPKSKTRKRFRPKDLKKENEPNRPLPGLQGKGLGNVIMQNWNTRTNIPKDIGNCYNLPVIVDRKKVEKYMTNTLYLPSLQRQKKPQKAPFGVNHFREAGERLLLATQTNTSRFSMQSLTVSSFSSKFQKTNTFKLAEEKKNSIESSLMATNINFKQKKDEQDQGQSEGQIVIYQQSNKKKIKTTELIDFENFNQHLYLQDNDFLYAKRTGGPIDFTLCSYQDINNTNSNKKGKLLTRKNFHQPIEYITISKNTILHYQRGKPVIYSINEWTDNFIKFKRLMQIPLFKNFKTAKMFELWRRSFKKTTRTYYTEKLKKRFQLLDNNLLKGLRDIKVILDEMENNNNIFLFKGNRAVYYTQFKDNHQKNLEELDTKIEGYRRRLKMVLASACNASYQEFKEKKKITLEDNGMVQPSSKDDVKRDNDELNEKKKKMDGSVKNFLKDQIPYAQDATRKTHYKKLLRFIRVVDYLFNESKFKLIKNSLNKLNQQFERYYEAYINKLSDSPVLKVTILPLHRDINYNPDSTKISNLIFEEFIQESIYTVVYRKSFLDPQEFPNYMSCFEEVFENTVDQNANLNNRIKDDPKVMHIYNLIRENFDNCQKALDDYAANLIPIYRDNRDYNAINFNELEKNCTPNDLKEHLTKFYKESEKVRQLKRIINIGLFELDLSQLLEEVNDGPRIWIEKMMKVIPKVIANRLNNLIKILLHHLEKISINVGEGDVDSFIKLKKGVEGCIRERTKVETLNNEISDLLEIVYNDKRIKLLDHDLKLISEQQNIHVDFERRIDSMSFFIENNIKQYQAILKAKIQKYDSEIKEMQSSLNEDKINLYSKDPSVPISKLESQESSIQKVINRKMEYQQLEADLDMEGSDRSDFENLNTLTYEYQLKCNLWHSIAEFWRLVRELDPQQVLKININEMSSKINKWIELCNLGLIDLDSPYVPKGFLQDIEGYEKIIPVLNSLQNPNVKEELSMSEEMKNILKISIDLKSDQFTLKRLMSIDNIYEKINDITSLSLRANEEKKMKDLIEIKTKEFNTKRLYFKFKQATENNNLKFLIFIEMPKDDLDREFEYIESSLLLLYKAQLNPSSVVIGKELKKLIHDLSQYMKFLNLYCDYQAYLTKTKGLLLNENFIKEMTSEIKKIINESQLKHLIKIIRENNTLQKFVIDNVYNKATASMKSLIDSFDKNNKAFNSFLDKKRAEYPKFFSLTDEELIKLYESKESVEEKEKLVYKLYPWIRKIEIIVNTSENLGEEFINIETIQNEKLSLKAPKGTRNLKDIIDLIDGNLVKKLKDCFKAFKKDYDVKRPRNDKKLKQVLMDHIQNKDNLAQSIFCIYYYSTFEHIEKALLIENEAFDKLFDIYQESKNDYRKTFIELAKDDKKTKHERFLYLSLIALENHFITIIEHLIRDDVQHINDFSFQKLMIPKIENDVYSYHFFSYQIEYGYEYTGFIDNFIQLSDSERFSLALINCFSNKKPFIIYGVQNSTLNYTLEQFYKVVGRNENKVICNEEFTAKSIDNLLYSNLKSGAWVVIDKAENLKDEIFEVVAERILEVYRVIRQSEEEGFYNEGTYRLQINVKNFNLFMVYNDIERRKYPKVIEWGYYRTFAVNTFDYKLFIELSLINLAIKNYDVICDKILCVINYVNAKLEMIMHKEMIMFIFIKLFKELMLCFAELKVDNERKIVSNAVNEAFKYFMTKEEINDVNSVIRRVFGSDDEGEQQNINNNNNDNNPPIKKDAIFEESLQKILNIYHFEDNSQYKETLMTLYDSIGQFKSFLLLGPPLSGKSTLLHLLRSFSSMLYEQNKKNYKEVLFVKIFPKANKPKYIFGSPELESQLGSFEFSHILSMFTPEKFEALYKMNTIDSEFYNLSSSLAGFDAGYDEIEQAILNPNIFLNPQRKVSQIAMHMGQDEGEIAEEELKEIPNIIKTIVFDGEIDDTWINYVSCIFDKFNFLTCPNGDIINMNKFKIIFETTSIKNATPSFCTSNYLISCERDGIKWDNLLYLYLDKNNKINKNQDIKNYIRGLFENYFPKLWDFVISNKLKCVDFGENFAMRNLITLFNSIIPIFNFEEKKVGRRKGNIASKIDMIKKSCLSIFIFSFAWTAMNLTNFVIRTKIEKLVSDIFKADDLKGPIFDFYIEEKTYDFASWESLLSEERKYDPILPSKGEIFYYNQFFVANQQNVPYIWIAEKLLHANVSIMLGGKPSSGKTILINSLLDDNDNDHIAKSKKINKVKYLISPNSSRDEVENHLIKNTHDIRRDTIGDHYGRRVIFFIDDVHLSCYNESKSPEIAEFLRNLNDTRSIFNGQKSIMKFLYKLNFICSGNLTSLPINTEFNRSLLKMFLLLEVIDDDSYVSIFKPTLEFHLRQYIPNTSSITATQYIQVLLKLNRILSEELLQSPKRIHIIPSLSDVTKVIQMFHMFVYKETTDYPEHLKKLFFYESTRVFEDRLTSKADVKFFREKICEAYSSVFKQDKVTPEQIFSTWDKDDAFLFSDNYADDINENIFYSSKKEFIDIIMKKIQRYIKNTNTIMSFDSVMLNESLLSFIIKILRALERERKNLIIIGKQHSGKEALFKVSAYITKCKVFQVDPLYAKISKKVFINEVINKEILHNAVYNNEKTILLIKRDLISVVDIREAVNTLFNHSEILNNFNFIKEESSHIGFKEIQKRLRLNVGVCIGIEPKTELYHTLFTQYPYIVKNSSILYKHSLKEDELQSLLVYSLPTYIIEEEKQENTIFTNLASLMYSIHAYAEELYKEYSKKIHIQLIVTPYHFINMYDFYLKNYNKYKEILTKKQKNANEAVDSIEKCEEVVKAINNDIDTITPQKEENDTLIANKKEERHKLNAQLGQLRLKKQEEDKILASLEKDNFDKNQTLESFLKPILDKIDHSLRPLRDLQEKDIVEIKNTYENFTFGKIIFGKVYELISSKDKEKELSTSTSQNIPTGTISPEVEWDTIKRALNVKFIQRFCNIKIDPSNELLDSISKEICSHSDFGTGDKYQKPFKTCGLICEYFSECNKYFNEYHNQSELLGQMKELSDKITNQKEIISGYINELKKVSTQMEENDGELSSCEKKKLNQQLQIDKKTSLLNITKNCLNLTKEKISMWGKKKKVLDHLYNNFSFYLLYISAYLSYAPPLNKIFRNHLKQFIYSKKNDSIINEFSLIELMTHFLDITGKDSNLFFSFGHFNKFYNENNLFTYIFDKKVPYLIDPHHIAFEQYSKFIQGREARTINKIIHNDTNINETIEKLEQPMKNGTILFIDLCHPSITSLLHNVIINKKLSGDGEKQYYSINKKTIEINKNFKLVLLKNTNKNEMVFFKDDWVNTLIINYSCTSDYAKEKLVKSLAMKYDSSLYNSLIKTKIDMQKWLIKLYENEKKLSATLGKFEFTSAVEKLTSQQTVLDNYERTVQENNEISSYIEKNKLKIFSINLNLEQFNLISEQGGKIFKRFTKFFIFNTIYDLPFSFFETKILTFYDEKYSQLDREMVKDREEHKEIEKQTEKEPEGEGEEDEKEEKQEEDDLEAILLRKKNIQNPSIYKKEDLLDLIKYLYKEIEYIYKVDISLNNTLLFSIVLFYLKVKEILPVNYKKILKMIYDEYLTPVKVNEDKKEEEQSPIDVISKEQWNFLNKISKNENDFLLGLINSMKKCPNVYNDLLNDSSDKNWLKHGLSPEFMASLFENPDDKLISEQLSPFDLLILYTITSPTKANVVIPFLLSSILPSYNIYNISLLEDVFNDSGTSPVLLVENNHIYEREILDNILPKMLKVHDDIKYKEIDLKGEITTSDIETITSITKSGGLIVIKNIHLASESITKLNTVLIENKSTLSELFKIIIIIDENKSNVPINPLLYEMCTILNHSNDTFEYFSFKTHIVNTIKFLPKEIYADLLNRKNPSFSLYMRKIAIAFIIIQVVLKQIPKYKPDIFITPIQLTVNDLIYCLNFLIHYFSLLPEDKEQLYSNIENEVGIHYLNVVNMAIEHCYLTRVVFKEDVERMRKIIMKFFDEEKFYSNECLFYFQNNDDETPEIVEIPNNNDLIEIKEQDLINIILKISDDSFFNIIKTFSSVNEANKVNSKGFVDFYYNIIYSIYGDENVFYNKIFIGEKVNIKKVEKIVYDIKMEALEPIIYSEEYAAPSLFKLNKQGDYSNPLDELLLIELKVFNKQIESLNKIINSLYSIIKGEMTMGHPFTEMVDMLNKDLAPTQWMFILQRSTTSKVNNISITQYRDDLKKKYNFYLEWVEKGGVCLYHLPYISNIKMFFSNLLMYFTRKNETYSPDMIQLKFNVMQYNKIEEIPEIAKMMQENEGQINRQMVNSLNYICVNGIGLINGNYDIEKQIISSSDNNEVIRVPIVQIAFKEKEIDINDKKKNNMQQNGVIEEEDGEDEDDKNGIQEEPIRKEEIVYKESNIIFIPLFEDKDIDQKEDRNQLGIFEVEFDQKFKEDYFIIKNLKMFILDK